MVFYWIFNMEHQLVNHTDGSLTPVENAEKNIPFLGVSTIYIRWCRS